MGYRTQAGMGATTLCSETPQSWANYQAYYDNTYGFHAYCLNQGWTECYKANCGTVGVSCLYPWHHNPGQCEAYGSGQPAFSWDSAVKSFYSEAQVVGTTTCSCPTRSVALLAASG